VPHLEHAGDDERLIRAAHNDADIEAHGA
jgi:hypothetical protein